MPKPLDRIQRNREYDARRRQEQPWRSLYKTPRWQAIRQAVYIRDGGKCQMQGCGRVTVKYHADHIKKHERGDPVLFWDMDNIQTLCPTCHNAEKQRIERGGRARQQVGTDGWPL